jgi:hypothetical protein
MAARIPVNITLPPDLVDELDLLVGPRGRSAYLERLVVDQLRRERVRTAWESVRGAWRGKGPAEWDEPDGVAKWVRALRAEVTDPTDEAAA